MRKLIVLFVGILIAWGPAKASTWDEYYTLLAKHKEAKTMAGSIITSYYYKNHAGPLKSEHGSFKMEGHNKYLNYDGYIMINNENYSVTLDKKNKLVMVSRAASKDFINDFLSSIPGAGKDSSEFRKNTAIQNTVNENNRKVYELSFAKGQYEKVIYEFAGSSLLLRKVIYVFREQKQFASNPAKVEIEYRDLIVDRAIGNEAFSEKAIVKVLKDKLILTGSYKDYQVLDYRKLQKYEK